MALNHKVLSNVPGGVEVILFSSHFHPAACFIKSEAHPWVSISDESLDEAIKKLDQVYKDIDSEIEITNHKIGLAELMLKQMADRMDKNSQEYKDHMEKVGINFFESSKEHHYKFVEEVKASKDELVELKLICGIQVPTNVHELFAKRPAPTPSPEADVAPEAKVEVPSTTAKVTLLDGFKSLLNKKS